jgi:hypothetical protein
VKIGGEEVEPIASLSDLRAGMIVWITDCDFCRNNHRGILTSADNEPSEDVDGEQSTDLTWNYIPESACGVNCFGTETIDVGAAFVVVDPKLDAKTTPRARELVRR